MGSLSALLGDELGNVAGSLKAFINSDQILGDFLGSLTGSLV